MSDKAGQTIPMQEIQATREALAFALRTTGAPCNWDWLSSRQSSYKPARLDEVLGKSGCYGSKATTKPLLSGPSEGGGLNC